MRIQDHIVQVSREAFHEFFRYVKAVPADRLEWKPEGTGQTILAMAREIAISPTWAVQVLSAQSMTDGQRAEQFALMSSWTSVEVCEAQATARFVSFTELAARLKDEELLEKRWLPFNGGRDHTKLEMLEYPRWNATYHTGQVAYIQTLYGDKDMH
ncbi:MAG: DinB family protein [Fimbriimonas sp.]